MFHILLRVSISTLNTSILFGPFLSSGILNELLFSKRPHSLLLYFWVVINTETCHYVK